MLQCYSLLSLVCTAFARSGSRPSGFQPYRDAKSFVHRFVPGLLSKLCTKATCQQVNRASEFAEDPVHAGGEERRAKDGLGVEGTACREWRYSYSSSFYMTGVDRGMWNVLYLFLNHKQFEEPDSPLMPLQSRLQKAGQLRAFPTHSSHHQGAACHGAP